MTNPYEDAARFRKADALASELCKLAAMEFDGLPFVETVRRAVEFCDAATPDLWPRIAAHAGVHPPSEETIALTRELLVRSLPAPRVTLDVGVFAGLPR